MLVFGQCLPHTQNTNTKGPCNVAQLDIPSDPKKKELRGGKDGRDGMDECIMVNTHVVTSTTQQTECVIFLFFCFVRALSRLPILHLYLAPSSFHPSSLSRIHTNPHPQLLFFLLFHFNPSLTHAQLSSTLHRSSLFHKHNPHFRTTSFSQKKDSLANNLITVKSVFATI